MARFSSAFDLDRSKISVDPTRFQGRQGAYSEDTVKAIVNKGKYDRNAEEIIVWQDPADGIYYVISGHSRFEAAERLFNDGKQPDLKTIPVKEFQGDEDDAIDFATIESNRGSTEEGLKSDLEAYRRAVGRGFNQKRLLAAFKPKSRLFKLKDLSNLNPKGSFVQYLGTDSEKHFPYLERNARWVGVMRDQLPLTNEHEQELFNFFYKENEAGQKLSKDQFFKLVNDKVNRIDFDASEALNLKNRVSTSALTDPITEQIREIDKNIEKLNREAAKKRESIARAKSEGIEDVIPDLQKRISDINTVVLRLTEDKLKLKSDSGRIQASASDLFTNALIDASDKDKERKKKESIKSKIKERAKNRKEFRPDQKHKIGDLINVNYRGKKYEGLKVIDIFWNEGNFLLPSRWEYFVELPSGKKVSSFRNKFEKFDSSKHKQGSVSNPYPLFDPDQTIYPVAYQAWNNQSFRPESRGNSFMEDHENRLKFYLEEFEKIAAKNGTASKVKSAFDSFAKKYRSFALDYLNKESGIVSTMISGPANFPVRRMEKKRNSARSTLEKWSNFEKKASKAIEKELRNEPDKLGDPRDELNVQRKKLENLKKTREQYKLINSAFRSYQKNPNSLEKNESLSESEKKMIRNWEPTYSFEKSPIAPYQLQNLGANIRRVEQRVKELEAKSKIADSDQTPIFTFDGGEVIYNAAANRIQIDFSEKPDSEIRSELKKSGFKWAPSVKMWQRAITDNALRSTANLTFLKHEGDYRDLFKKKSGTNSTDVDDYSQKKYKGVFGDYDGDGILNVDDPNPEEAGDSETVEEVKLSDEIAALIDFRKKYDDTREDFVKILRDKAQGESDILSRTKTPYSIINKLRRKRLTGSKGITDVVGTMVVFPNQAKLEDFKEKVNGGAFGKVLEFDDYYKSPQAGYKAYHWNVIYDGSPVEIQAKTERMKKIASANHTLYKEGKSNPKLLLKLTDLMEKADRGDSEAEKFIDPIINDKAKLVEHLTKKKALTHISKNSKTVLSPMPLNKKPTNLVAAAKEIRAFLKRKFPKQKLSVRVDKSKDTTSSHHILVQNINGNQPLEANVKNWFNKALKQDETVREYGVIIYIGEVKKVLEAINKKEPIALIDRSFEQNAKRGGVVASFLEKENDSKEINTGRKLSASERAKSLKKIRSIVKAAEEKPGELTTEQVIAIGRKINAERSMYGVFMDLEADHKKRRWPTEKNLKIWAQNPGKSDLIGVDNAKKNDATVGFNRGLFFMLPLID